MRFLSSCFRRDAKSARYRRFARCDWRSRGGARDCCFSAPDERLRTAHVMRDNSNGAARRVAEIAAEYKTRYRQESVLITRDRVDVCGQGL